MAKTKKPALSRVRLKSATSGTSEEHQNQSHNTVKQALGPNTRR